MHVPEFAAGVCFYGIPPKEFADPAKIRVPLQGHFANKDDWCTPAAVDDLERALKAAGVKHEIYRYDAAHAFANERSAAYDVALRQPGLGAHGGLPEGANRLAATGTSRQRQNRWRDCRSRFPIRRITMANWCCAKQGPRCATLTFAQIR